MANLRKKLPANVPGDFFVDSTCINCDACRQVAPEVFAEIDDASFVRHQPATADERRTALRALLTCPTGSIGNLAHDDLTAARGDFPLQIEQEVSFCGFTSPKSYGGNSYLVEHPAGNWLIDSPKFLPALVERLERRGGVRTIFLTHSDDVADAARFAAHFGSQRIIHRRELDAQPDAEIVPDGTDPIAFAADFTMVPTPGHTAGHCVLLYRNRFLFSGDHLDWDRDEKRLAASRSYCWDSWLEQTQSMARLIDYRFEWVLPGHGQRVQLPADEMRRQLRALVERMRAE
jgi:glyoxylase-like metal-dependent hydrolase (beta-lactamase superfamily II)/ferredoxin